MKVYISPQFKNEDRADGGIRRVVEAQRRYLTDFNIEVVDSVSDADVINCHAGDLIDYPPDKPLVASSHGLYWSNYEWPPDHYLANQMVIENMVRSKVVTAPSLWVAQALRRGICRPVVPIHHGVDVDEWEAGENSGYVLWNKARSDPVSDVNHMLTLAKEMPDQKFLSTVGFAAGNVGIIGVQPYEKMKPFIQDAGVYLSTARETFGIGTLEAMACGVPIAGWDFGGNSEIIIPGETGYLAPYGDYKALAEAVRTAVIERDRLSANCLADVRGRWLWPDKIRQYAKIFNSLWAGDNIARPKVSIIVTCYNLGKYLNDCLDSVLRLPFADWECIIVDDKSTDDTRSIAKKFCIHDERFIYREPEVNLGLSGARNFGFESTAGKYVFFLDADDMVTPRGLMPLIESLDSDPSIHIAYGNLLMMSEDGSSYHSEISVANEFNWFAQMAHINQPFYCVLMRSEVMRDSAGYRVRDWRAEDASFWCRVTSFGFRAKKVTEEPTVFYRLRPDSKGAIERAKYPDGDGDWCAWYGWRLASNYQDGLKAVAKKKTPPPDLVPFGVQAKPPGDVKSWNVDHHQDPLVSVVIPVGPGHGRYVIDALDSLTAQTFTSWEAVVINDTGKPLDLPGHAWATVIDTAGSRGAGHARNQGLQAARGDLVYFLDGDDWLLSNALHDSVQAFIKHGATRYIYTNYMSVDRNGKVKHERLKPYEQDNWHGQHAINALMWRQDALGVGGFDEELPGWEDWDFAIKCALNGVCGELLPVETFVYRKFSGQRRDLAASSMEGLLPILKERYQEYYTGANEIMSCGCRGNGAEILMKAKQAVVAWATVDRPEAQEVSSMTRMKFIGARPGSKTYERIKGQLLQRKYRGGNNSVGRYIDADPADVELLESTGEWAAEDTPQIVESVNLPAPVEINYVAIGQEADGIAASHVPAMPAMPARPASVERYEAGSNATPKAIDLARENDVDLAKIIGSGANGRITIRDVRNAITSS
jgi:glycosyltransferase involved in cell wall biosynthesis